MQTLISALPPIAVLSLIGLAVLYFLSLYTGYKLRIAKDAFYAPFHFLGGVLVGLFFYSLTNRAALSILLTVAIGILWEIYEQIVWKIFVKKKKLQPKRQDTINDLVLDMLGSALAVYLIH